MWVTSALALLLWLFIVPMGMGFLVQRILPFTKKTIGITFLCGYLLSFAVFEVIAIWCMLKIQYGAFHKCSIVYAGVEIFLAIVGFAARLWDVQRAYTKGANIFFLFFPGDQRAKPEAMISPRTDVRVMKFQYARESLIYWGLFALIVAFQLVMAVVKAPFDGDDAYYVVESVLAQQADVMNTIHPYLGISTPLGSRHALAVFTMWIAFIAKMSGIHATIVSHVVMPIVLIPMTYLIYLEIGRILMGRRQDLLPVYMIFISLMAMFGNTSIYTPETFLMMRTWQGKSMVANFVLPFVIWLFLWMFDDCRKPGFLWNEETGGGLRVVRNSTWILLFILNMVSGIMSSMGIVFGTGLAGLFSLLLLIYTRDFRIIPKAILSVVPTGIYLLIYASL
ncbi:DUF6077 domain-containing protein [Butyrivibrio sp. INlla16]|uniref:DUF6077 domain-containing protein n=1 Tax=Butyrivibrio sp. INlla16 TaxID=1520807 RepID=UPI0008923B82|nr:DUF6077 domain-containing protein [Butyrivibrio sp. INlla16]SDB46837.1 hypothetical protein SAMN02910263_02306 [Butyrivibrio sp. INlla16]